MAEEKHNQQNHQAENEAPSSSEEGEDNTSLAGLAALAAALKQVDPDGIDPKTLRNDEEGWEDPSDMDLAELEGLEHELEDGDMPPLVDGEPAPSEGGQASPGESDAEPTDAELAQLLAILSGEVEVEPEQPREPETLTPERLCYLALEHAFDQLIKDELVELVKGKQKDDVLEDMVNVVLEAASFEAALSAALSALVDSEHLEEVYGDDDELLTILRNSFQTIQAQTQQ